MKLIDTCLLSRHVSTLNLVLFLCSPIARVARCLPLCCSSVATTVDRLCALSSSACKYGQTTRATKAGHCVWHTVALSELLEK